MAWSLSVAERASASDTLAGGWGRWVCGGQVWPWRSVMAEGGVWGGVIVAALELERCEGASVVASRGVVGGLGA
jgi:hypothetical protein